ncbi:MAG: hypothetical protein A3D24_04595 [Candidatus Blackburnbacteria bacterium RIFCSPHIGHO2_02_FULL_39_13]|uniref:histidine kinase n=1 Tax=Candidatus Blackburnbacteria bacterium RIFCSPLOWO2_01_FULL_40_20 TaxID=1797519 RepID=A0A1G1VEV1_9BACT|nr:MAG: Multi-sensor signal transduction histidine kinase [Microgenomates group bacterium GW2011_GWA2_39_19]OGY07243.1 MAG: hypothetical protein A2694_03190 [Candidatus Blackburnbacteria bacterium RIFCSPHIGHO2_01_FULL_40_17]OGY09704.1 MAG: hypothetical protein A3D24_04595 [Candidatus Blackburnbacteria bacterium RIFCSPHIGHO2_02_FULL_39_13]OGY13983.1 MAG: hypothetical protein A3A77_02770 [Candidatus Blackburnbacteria bacterium RIFCSPLOWO2_01_FULL_40_20]OGY15539.1 MAG: hypothetical protein A3I52_0
MASIIERINIAALKFLVPLTPEETYIAIVHEATRLIGAMYGSIVLEERGKLARVYSSSPIAFKTINRKFGNTYTAFKEKKVIIADISDVSHAHPELNEIGVKTSVFIPLSYRNKSIGVLTVNLDRKPRGLEENLDVLKLFGSMASLAIRKAQLNDETKKALEIRDLFISMAAHEFRTPLTTITVYLQLLKRKVEQMGDPALVRWSDELTSEAVRLNILINELLVINRIKTGELQYFLKVCSLKDIIDRAIINFSSTYQGRLLNYKDCVLEDRALVVGDFDKLLQVFTNVFENAAKYSSPETDVVVELDLQKNYFVVQVKDRGRGIPKENLARVFEEFYKGSKDPHEEGMGLGLYLSKNIVTKHRGTIDIRSRVGRGTVVYIRLPKAKA